MPGMKRKMPKKMRGGGMAAPKAMPLKRGGGVRGRGRRSVVQGPSFEITAPPEEQTRPLIVPDESGGKRKTPIKPKFVTAKPERPLKRFQSGGGVSKSAVRSCSKKPL